MAIWIERADNTPAHFETGYMEAQNNTCTDPRNDADSDTPLSPALQAWRDFVKIVQRHLCYEKCHWKNKKRQGDDFCKYLYPHARCPASESPRLNLDTQRYQYTCLEKEDEIISPYIPEWLLAWGAQMNIQYCTGAGFLSYIAKYITKAEPHAMINDNEDLRRRENMPAAERFLQARVVGAPEAVFRAFQYDMHTGIHVTRLITAPPHLRTRALKKHLSNLEDDPYASVFADGTLEVYMNRPEAPTTSAALVPGAATAAAAAPPRPAQPDFENMKYPDFHRHYTVEKFKNISATMLKAGKYWRQLNQADDSEYDDHEPDSPAHPESYWVVPRITLRPVIYDFKLPDKHGMEYYYQKLLLNIPFRDATPSALVDYTNNPHGTLKQECIVRNLIPEGDLVATVTKDAEDRLFSPEQVMNFTTNIEDFVTAQRIMSAINRGPHSRRAHPAQRGGGRPLRQRRHHADA